MQIIARFDGMDRLLANLSQHARQIPFATSLALNWTATGVRIAGASDMRDQFDKPVPAVRAGLWVVNSSKDNLAAEVRVKQPGDKGWPDRSLAEIIGQQFAGGSRQQKTIERALVKAGLLGAGEYIVPGAGAQLDAYGNIARKQLKQIYASLGLLAGNAPAKPADRGRKKAPAQRYFWSAGTGRTAHLHRGLWTIGEHSLQLVLVVVAAVSYKRRINLGSIAAVVVARDFRKNFIRGMNQAIKGER